MGREEHRLCVLIVAYLTLFTFYFLAAFILLNEFYMDLSVLARAMMPPAPSRTRATYMDRKNAISNIKIYIYNSLINSPDGGNFFSSTRDDKFQKNLKHTKFKWENEKASRAARWRRRRQKKKRDKQTSPPIFMLMKYFILRSVL